VGGRGRGVVEYWGWAPARDDKRFANKRAEVSWTLRRLLEDGTAELPPDPMLREECLGMEYTLDGKGRIQMLDKDSLRKALGRSPDRYDSATIALATSSGVIVGPTVRFSSVSV
jgi:hypothetical protein